MIGELQVFTTMYDGIGNDARAIRAIVKPGDAVAHYKDGYLSHWTPEEVALFDSAFDVDMVAITVLGDPTCAIADVENGDMTPAQGRLYIRRRRQLGHQACLYCNKDTIPF